jgi:hypothetical protein
MNAQLQEIRADLEAASARLERLERALSPGAWLARSPTGGWSPVACVAHLNLTSERFLPLMRTATRAAPPLPIGSDRRLRRNLVGWLLWLIMPPPVRFGRTRTTAPFLPTAELDAAVQLTEFRRLQTEQTAFLESVVGLAIDRVYITSPFDARLRYDLFSCLGILARHQHRHLWQAERAAAAAGAAALPAG